MPDRYQRVYLSRTKLYSEGSPVIIEACALLKDIIENKVLAQIKIRNISEKTIIACKVAVKAFEPNGSELEGVSEFSYLDLRAVQGKDFGPKQPIHLPDHTARRITVKVLEVVFDDESVWGSSSDVWKPISEQETVENYFENRELRKQYQITVGENCKYIPRIADGLFLCTCGTANLATAEKCYKCKRFTRTLLETLNEEELKEAAKIRMAKEEEERKAAEKARRIRLEREAQERRIAEEEAIKRAEQDRLIAEKRHKKRKKIIITVGAIVVIIAMIGGYAARLIKDSESAAEEYCVYIQNQMDEFVNDRDAKNNGIQKVSFEVSDARRDFFGDTVRLLLTINCETSVVPDEETETAIYDLVTKYVEREQVLPSGRKISLLSIGRGQKERLTILLNGMTIETGEEKESFADGEGKDKTQAAGVEEIERELQGTWEFNGSKFVFKQGYLSVINETNSLSGSYMIDMDTSSITAVVTTVSGEKVKMKMPYEYKDGVFRLWKNRAAELKKQV